MSATPPIVDENLQPKSGTESGNRLFVTELLTIQSTSAELTLEELNDEIRLAREERDKQSAI